MAKSQKNPLLAKPQVDPSKHKLHRAGSQFTADLAKWAGMEGQDLYAGVHVSPSPSAAAAYALGRLKVDGDVFEVTDAPVLLGLSASKHKDLGDVDMLTTAKNIVELADAHPDLTEDDDLSDFEDIKEVAAGEGFDSDMGLVQACGNWANMPADYDLFNAIIEFNEFRQKRKTPEQLRAKAIELAKGIVPQIRWASDVPDAQVVAVVVLPPFKPMDEIARRNEPFPYDTSADEEFRNEPIDRDYLDAFIRDHWKVLWGDPSKAKFWHGTSASLAAKALPSIVNQYAANELSFDPTPYREEFEEDLEENPSAASLLSPNQRKKYLAGLKGAQREARAEEIVYRREHRSNEPFVTDEGQPTHHSSHADNFERKYGRHAHDVADAAKLTGIPKKILDEVYARGLAAWQTGHRPGASQHAWAMARLYSFATGGPTVHGPDRDLAEKAGMKKNPASPTHIPPGPVAAAAQRGLDLRASQPASNRCCTSVGLRRAAQLANRQPVSEDTMRRMLSYFQRHTVDRGGRGWGTTSKGWQAWLCWGGDEGYAWVRRVLGA